MTTASNSAVLDNSSSAGFRAWVAELIALFASAGLVQTSDTGQIDTATVAVPANNTIGGYAIFRFSDSSLYLKFEFGTNFNGTGPDLICTVGTGSNGTGTVNGSTATRVPICSTNGGSNTIASAVTSYTSYACHNGDAFSLIWKANSTNSSTRPAASFVVGKTVDPTSGLATSTGYQLLYQSGSSTTTAISVNISTGVVVTSSAFVCFPGAPTSSTLGSGNSQAYLTWIALSGLPVRAFAWAVGYIVSEATELSGTFSITPVGAQSRTFIPNGELCGSTLNGQSSGTYSLAFIWE